MKTTPSIQFIAYKACLLFFLFCVGLGAWQSWSFGWIAAVAGAMLGAIAACTFYALLGLCALAVQQLFARQ